MTKHVSYCTFICDRCGRHESISTRDTAARMPFGWFRLDRGRGYHYCESCYERIREILCWM